jgi:hypothetical protein
MGIFSWKKRREERKRLLFRYHNGQSRVVADPMLLWRAILNHPKLDLATAGAFIDAGQEPESSEALQTLCDIFGLVRFDPQTGAGLTDLEVLDVAGQFSEYMDLVKKNISPGPMPPPPGDSWSSISLEPQDEPANASSDSSSTAAEPSCAAATE